MGFLSNLFSKQTCAFCGKEVGALGRKKLQDNNYICKECEKNCSAFIDPSRFDVGYLTQHIEHMKKQDILYKKEFETLDKKQKDRIVHKGYYGICFADDIAMFEVIDPKANKRNYKELFRYDQIQDYEVYTVDSTGEDQKKYSEVGVIINIRCAIGYDALGEKNSQSSKIYHPYVDKLKILCGRDENDTSCTNLIISHLDRIFGKARTDLAGSIKESIIGTTKERQAIKTGAESLKAFASMAKAGITKKEEDKEAAKEKLKGAAESGFDLAFNNMGKYQKLANAAEERAWKE